MNQPENWDAHVRALEAEYRYLHDAIRQVLGIEVNIAALVRSNASRPLDWDALLETNLPFLMPTDDEVTAAEDALRRLREAPL